MDSSTFLAATSPQSVLRNAVLAEIQKKGKELNLQPIDLTDRAVAMDGALVRHTSENSSYVPSLHNSVPADFLEDRLDVVGQYGHINGVAHWVNEDGQAFTGFVDDAELIEAGYIRSSQAYGPFPTLYGSINFSEPDKKAEWNRICTLHSFENDARNKVDFLTKCEERAGDIKVASADLTENGQRFMKMDGLHWRNRENTKHGQYTTTDLYVDCTQHSRYTEVGTYHVRGGILAFVDEAGHLQIGKDTQENLTLLDSAGYKWNKGADWNEMLWPLNTMDGCLVGYANHFDFDETVVRRFATTVGWDADQYVVNAQKMIEETDPRKQAAPEPAEV